MTKSVEKDKALAQVLADIEKQFGKGSIMKLGSHEERKIDVCSSGSLSLDIALGAGGYPRVELLKYMDQNHQEKRHLLCMQLLKYKKKVEEQHL